MRGAPQGPVWLPALKSLFFTSNRYQAGSQDPAEDGSTDQRIDMFLLRTDTGELQQARRSQGVSGLASDFLLLLACTEMGFPVRLQHHQHCCL